MSVTYYYGKIGHKAINWKICAGDILKEKLKESNNISIIENPSNNNSDDDFIEEKELVLF